MGLCTTDLSNETKITALQLNRWDFDKKATLSPQAQQELSWWVNNVTSSHNVLTRGKPSYTLTTDASKQGWGAVLGTHCTGGLWAALEIRNHINPHPTNIFYVRMIPSGVQSDPIPKYAKITLEYHFYSSFRCLKMFYCSFNKQLTILVN